uniref:Uncharacterized protein n=1 Tax=Oryza meridionalis TaxID=40149 RepID=A0A0E0CKJ1_9ORYZ
MAIVPSLCRLLSATHAVLDDAVTSLFRPKGMSRSNARLSKRHGVADAAEFLSSHSLKAKS